MSQSHAKKWILLLHTMLNQAFGQPELLPARTAAELATLLTSQQTTEGPTSPLFGMIGRRDRSTAPPAYDSGKKQCQTITNLRVLDEAGQIGFLSATYAGKANDTILAEWEGYRLPPGSDLSQEMGFQGCVLADVTIIQPQKKPRGGELTLPEKATKRRISSIRIRIEHAIGGVKRYRMVKDNIRLLQDGMRDTMMETCCGLHNDRLQYRPWHYAS